jgi:hypothetical protein
MESKSGHLSLYSEQYIRLSPNAAYNASTIYFVKISCYTCTVTIQTSKYDNALHHQSLH